MENEERLLGWSVTGRHWYRCFKNQIGNVDLYASNFKEIRSIIAKEDAPYPTGDIYWTFGNENGMKIIHKEGDIKFVQTHEDNGHIWIHIGMFSAPLAKCCDCDDEEYFYYYIGQDERRIYPIHGVEWDKAESTN